MYVNIKNYVNLKRSRLSDHIDDGSFKAKFLSKLDDLLNFIYDHSINIFLRKIKRKVHVRIDKYDIYNADHTIALIVLPILKRIAETTNGAPFVDINDVPLYLKPAPKANEYDTDDTHFDRWNWVLNEMIWAFSQIIRDDRETQFYSGNIDIKFIKSDEKGYYEMVRGPNDTFSVDTKSQEEYENRIQNGLNLFAKYYNNLWT